MLKKGIGKKLKTMKNDEDEENVWTKVQNFAVSRVKLMIIKPSTKFHVMTLLV
jgi:hypothetical protein